MASVLLAIIIFISLRSIKITLGGLNNKPSELSSLSKQTLAQKIYISFH